MSDIYESGRYVGEYLLFHFGKPKEILSWPFGPETALNFPVRTVGHFSGGEVGRALDVGCAVGRYSFEMSSHAREVIGIDFSLAFIESAERIRLVERLGFDRLEEAGEATRIEVGIPDQVIPERVRFEVGDAMNLRPDLGSFDRVHAANLVCRLPEPRRFLQRLAELVNQGGELVLATPCTWLEEFTAKENWSVGGTLDWLKK